MPEMRAFATVAAATLLGAASASPVNIHTVRTTPTGSNITNTTSEPCALVSQQWQQYNGTVDPDLAFQCLQSVPLDAKGATTQIDGIKTFVQFQSTLAYLDDPPKGYLYPAVDIMGALEQISNNLAQGKYSNEYDFQTEIRNVVWSAYDGHFTYLADITTIFRFGREMSLYSLSKDGLSLPDVYLDSYPLPPQNETSRNETVSPVAKINGEEVQLWMNKNAAKTGNAQDPDANYNYLTPNLQDGGLPGAFSSGIDYLGPYTNITFQNGTTTQVKHSARSALNLTGIVDGPSFFQRCCTAQGKELTASQSEQSSPSPSHTSSSAATIIPTTPVPFQAVPRQSVVPANPGFPAPYIVSDDGLIAGYFPEEEPDLAVLSITSFLTSTLNAGTQFSNVVRMFLASAQAAGKTRLVVDLRDNGGGQIALGYDLFTQLFPDIQPYGATNFRATPLLNDLGTIVSGYYSNVTEETAGIYGCGSTYSLPPFNYRGFYDMDNHEFDSWKDFFGPKQHYGDNFTSLSRYDLNDKLAFGCSANISNYGDLQNITPPVFRPEDVLLVQNGNCGSTCAIFSEFMKTQAKTKQVVFGGRRQPGPMQSVGAVKGANVYPFETFANVFETTLMNNTTPAQARYLNDTYGEVIPAAIYATSRASSGGAQVNIRNNIREGDGSFTPLQFVYEAADCRLFYTADMYAKQSLVWKAAYDVIWNGAACVEGSMGHPSSRPGGVEEGCDPPENAYSTFSIFPQDLTVVRLNTTGTDNGAAGAA